jgi:uncharacterized protein YhhL (DUF1145 family)
MITVAKIACIAVYALGLLSALGMLPASWHIIATIAAVVLAAHAIEVVVAFKHVRRYQGSLAMSIVLTLLFGVLHWMPIANSTKNSAIQTIE